MNKTIEEKLLEVAENVPKVYEAGYNKCLEENPPGATEEELQAKYWEGVADGQALGFGEGYSKGEEEGLEYTLNGLIEIAKIQEDYLAEPMSFYIMSMVTYEAEKIECMTSDIWEDIVTNDYNGIISQDGIYIDENDGYAKYATGSYLRGDDGSYCKSYNSPRPNITYWPIGDAPIEQGGE